MTDFRENPIDPITAEDIEKGEKAIRAGDWISVSDLRQSIQQGFDEIDRGESINIDEWIEGLTLFLEGPRRMNKKVVTVGELIAELQKADPSKPVIFVDSTQIHNIMNPDVPPAEWVGSLTILEENDASGAGAVLYTHQARQEIVCNFQKACNTIFRLQESLAQDDGC